MNFTSAQTEAIHWLDHNLQIIVCACAQLRASTLSPLNAWSATCDFIALCCTRPVEARP